MKALHKNISPPNTGFGHRRLPSVSVLAPCRNEVDYIENCLLSLLDSDYPPELFEILIIDGMSIDGTRTIVADFAQKELRVRMIDNPGRIVPSGMNIGILEAKGEYIIRVDCHAEFPPNYISKCVETMLRTGAGNVGGYWETASRTDTSTARAIVLATSSAFGVGNALFRISGGKEREVDTVPFGTFKKDLLIKLGGYDDRLARNQDIELNSRIIRSGERIVISPEIQLRYFNRETLRGIADQAFHNGLWNPYTVWLTGKALSTRHFVPMLFVLSLMGLGVAALADSAWFLLLGITLGTYLVSALYFARKENPKKHRTSVLQVMLIYSILHFSYGLGSLWGIISTPFKFPVRRKQSMGISVDDREK